MRKVLMVVVLSALCSSALFATPPPGGCIANCRAACTTQLPGEPEGGFTDAYCFDTCVIEHCMGSGGGGGGGWFTVSKQSRNDLRQAIFAK